MKDWIVQEMPNINDSDLIRNCVCVQDMRRTLVAFVQFVVSQLANVPVTVSIRVVLSILDRVAEGALSVEVLCQKGRARDAAILLLSLHELRLDLQYMACDTARTDTWLDHTETNRKPWRVGTQIKEIFSDPNEREAELWLYRQYSMGKHGNPIGQQFAFRISPERDSLAVDCSGSENPLLRTHLFGLGYHIYEVGVAGGRILTHDGMKVGSYLDTLKEQWEKLKKYHNQHIHLVVEEYLSSKDTV